MKLSKILLGGHHEEPYEVPHYTTYNDYKKCPELVAHEERLARLGLKDPWIRNYAHNFDPKIPKTGYFTHMWTVSKAGFAPGLAIAAGMIAIEETYSYFKHGHTSWAGH